MCIFYSCQFALGLFLFKNVGPSSGTKRRAGNMASMSGADDNLYTEFKKNYWDIHCSKNSDSYGNKCVYVLFLSISSSTFLLKTVGTSGGTKNRTGNMTLMSGAEDNLHTEFKKSKNL